MTNLMPYSSFEGSIVPTVYSNLPTFDTAHFLAGTRGLKQTLSGATGYWSDGDPSNSARWVTATAGTQYTLSIYAYADGAMNVQIKLEWYDSGNASLGNVASTASAATVNNWTRFTVTGTAPVATAKAFTTIELSSSASGRSVWFDEIQLETGASATTWVPGPNDTVVKAEAGSTAVTTTVTGTVARRKAAAGTAAAVFVVGGTVRKAKPAAGTTALTTTAAAMPMKLKIVGGTAAFISTAGGTVTYRKKPAGSGQVTATVVGSGKSVALIV